MNMPYVEIRAEDVLQLLPPRNDHPSYLRLIPDTYVSVSALVKARLTPIGEWKNGYYEELVHFFYMTWFELYLVLVTAAGMTLARYLFASIVAIPLASHLGLTKLNHRKFPESLWKLIFYTSSWAYCYHIVFHAGYDLFDCPVSCWKNHSMQGLVPPDLLTIYLIQGSFYTHSLYATLYMDENRKDTLVMVLHHMLTVTLLAFSHAFRYHRIGVMIVFTHDATDICLEFAKLMGYMKILNGKIYNVFEYISNIGFVLFAISWILFRLYWYPLKALYAAGHSTAYFVPTQPYLPSFVILLWILFMMNIYWFHFIFIKFIGVVFLNEREIRDTREDEDEEIADRQESMSTTPKKKQAMNNNSQHHSSNEHLRRRN